jgi:hypothetical protein
VGAAVAVVLTSALLPVTGALAAAPSTPAAPAPAPVSGVAGLRVGPSGAPTRQAASVTGWTPEIPGAQLDGPYRVVLAGPVSPVMATAVNDALGQAAATTRVSLVLDGIVRPGTVPYTREMVITASGPGTPTPCGTLGNGLIGCASWQAQSALRQGHAITVFTGGTAWVDVTQPWTFVRNATFHELGHLLGLGHFDGTFLGQTQVMAPVAHDNPPLWYQAGDLAGLRASAPPGIPTGYWINWPIAAGLASKSTAARAVLDAWGGLHLSALTLNRAGAPYWRNWGIARDVALDGHVGGVVLDGWGGLHSFGGSTLDARGAPYWKGWDIARGVAADPVHNGLVVVDAWGGLHASGGARLPAGIRTLWKGKDVARDVAYTPDGRGIYILDASGGLHAFGATLHATQGPLWPGWDVAKSLTIWPDGTGGAILDVFGGVHEFALR